MTVKYTIETPIVKAFIEFLAIPHQLREEELRTRVQFMAKFEIKSPCSLFQYERIEGFWKAVREANSKFKEYYNTKVDDSLFERTQGVTGEKTQYNYKTREMEQVTYEIPPDVRAIELHKKICDGYTETIKHKGEITVLDMLNKTDEKKEEKDK